MEYIVRSPLDQLSSAISTVPRTFKDIYVTALQQGEWTPLGQPIDFIFRKGPYAGFTPAAFLASIGQVEGAEKLRESGANPNLLALGALVGGHYHYLWWLIARKKQGADIREVARLVAQYGYRGHAVALLRELEAFNLISIKQAAINKDQSIICQIIMADSLEAQAIEGLVFGAARGRRVLPDSEVSHFICLKDFSPRVLPRILSELRHPRNNEFAPIIIKTTLEDQIFSHAQKKWNKQGRLDFLVNLPPVAALCWLALQGDKHRLRRWVKKLSINVTTVIQAARSLADVKKNYTESNSQSADCGVNPLSAIVIDMLKSTAQFELSKLIASVSQATAVGTLNQFDSETTKLLLRINHHVPELFEQALKLVIDKVKYMTPAAENPNPLEKVSYFLAHLIKQFMEDSPANDTTTLVARAVIKLAEQKGYTKTPTTLENFLQSFGERGSDMYEKLTDQVRTVGVLANLPSPDYRAPIVSSNGASMFYQPQQRQSAVQHPQQPVSGITVTNHVS